VPGYRWFPFAKGGEYSPYYADLHLVVNWELEGAEIEEYVLGKYPYLQGNASWILHRECDYFRPGLTWPRRTTSGISIRVFPAGCNFADKGPCAFVEGGPFWLGLLQSAAFESLIGIQLAAADAAARSYEVGLIQHTPVPNLPRQGEQRLGELARSAINLKRALDTANETSHVFHLPALLQVQGQTLTERITNWQAKKAEAERKLAEYQREIDDIAFRLYGIDGESVEAGEETEETGADE
jgi:hypothetical protein